MTTISAKCILASRNTSKPDAVLYTLQLRYPRAIHAEVMTHRVFSRNASSSRAIPVERLIQDVIDDPFIPLHWGKNQKGMQAFEENDEPVGNPWDQMAQDLISREFPNFSDPEGKWHPIKVSNTEAWLAARDCVVRFAKEFSDAGYHKQIVNRLLEPWAHMNVVVSSTQWSNFLALRDHPAAEPHIQMLAREIKKAINGAEIQDLNPDEWHLPYVSDVEQELAWGNPEYGPKEALLRLQKLSIARCASVSYKTVDGKPMTVETADRIYDQLLAGVPIHASPAEHVAKADEWVDDIPSLYWMYPELHGNFTGFCQYRKYLQNECL